MSTPSRSAYVISAQEIDHGWVVLYIITAALAITGVMARFFVTYPLLWLLFKILGQSTRWVQLLCQVIAWAPLAISFATLILPLGGWLWQQQSGDGLHQSASALSTRTRSRCSGRPTPSCARRGSGSSWTSPI